jgi:hypothetical protein
MTNRKNNGKTYMSQGSLGSISPTSNNETYKQTMGIDIGTHSPIGYGNKTIEWGLALKESKQPIISLKELKNALQQQLHFQWVQHRQREISYHDHQHSWVRKNRT